MTSNTRRDTPLAIHGGPPVREALLPYGRQTLTEADVAAATEVLRSEEKPSAMSPPALRARRLDVGAPHALGFTVGLSS